MIEAICSKPSAHILSILLLAIGLLMLGVSQARAHDARPLSINITQQSTGLYLARLRVPPTVAFDNHPQISWPADCRILNEQQGDAQADSETLTLSCKNGLEGQRIAIHYPYYNPSLATLFRLKESNGQLRTLLLSPDEMTWQVPMQPGLMQVAASYLMLGVGHIWGGPDHLLFVAGLLILAGTVRRVLLAITGFTLAHSVTLSLSALNLVVLPVPPVEAAIALSILFLAREIAHPHPQGLAARYPIMVSSSFGLLHGFGFAAALREVGLPTDELAAGLLCFNLGVEVGQIAFIALVVALFLAGRQLLRRANFSLPVLEGRMTRFAGYALGIPAAFWFIQRLGPVIA